MLVERGPGARERAVASRGSRPERGEESHRGGRRVGRSGPGTCGERERREGGIGRPSGQGPCLSARLRHEREHQQVNGEHCGEDHNVGERNGHEAHAVRVGRLAAAARAFDYRNCQRVAHQPYEPTLPIYAC